MFKAGEQFIFGKRLDQKYYDGLADELHISAQQIYKLSTPELLEMLKSYKEQVAELQKKIP